MSSQSDNELISYVAQGDRSAFTELVRRYKDRITNFIFTILHDRETAVDLAQDTFIRVYYKANTFRGAVQFSTWLYRIATNLAINELRRRKRHTIFSMDTPDFSGKDFENDSERWDLPDHAPLQDECYEVKELQLLVHEAMNKIPPIYKIPLILKEIEGYRYEEIAEILNIPEGTVKSRINRARQALKQQLIPHLDVQGILVEEV